MDIDDLARKLGSKIQEDERYLNLKIAEQINNEDSNLQALINEFNLKRISVSHELSKSNHDDEKIKLLNKDLKKCYNNIVNNENMINYNHAKTEFDALIQKINSIIMECANGENPKTAGNMKSDCSGNCFGCTGCH